MTDDNEFKDLESVVNKLVKDLFESDDLKDLTPNGKVVYDFNLKMKQGNKLVKKSKDLEPMVDIIDEGNSYRVLFEIPGLEEDKLDLKITPLNLNLKVKGLAGFYSKEVTFKDLIVIDSVKANYNNGILEVHVLKEKKSVSKKK